MKRRGAPVDPELAAVLALTVDERRRQIRKGWTRKHDDESHKSADFARFIGWRATGIREACVGSDEKAFLQIAALAIAAVELIRRFRKQGKEA